MGKSLVYLSPHKDPFLNHAIEMTLFKAYEAYESILMLWVNAPAFVLGRNQNPWREIDIEQAKQQNIPILRRYSGGGTVYHDEGNLNFSFIKHHQKYDEAAQFQMVIDAAKKLGIPLALSNRKDLLCCDKKISGNAFYLKGKRRMHHGTLLIGADLEAIKGLLKAKDPEHLSRFTNMKSVASVSSPVMNLNAYVPSLTVSQMINAIVDTYYKAAGYDADVLEDAELFERHRSHIDQMAEDLKTWEWTFGQTPSFDYRADDNRIVSVKSGKIIPSGVLEPTVVHHLENNHFRR
ncbi:lipoate--protein ligase family protein [Fusibacter sp. JL298sf-3]